MLVCLDGNRLYVLNDGDGRNITAYRMHGKHQYGQLECCVSPFTEEGVSDFYRRIKQVGGLAEKVKKTRTYDLAWAVRRKYISLPEAIQIHLQLHFSIDPAKLSDLKIICAKSIEAVAAGLPKTIVFHRGGYVCVAGDIVTQYDLKDFVE